MGFSVRSEGQNYSIYPKVPFSPSEACGRWASADRLHCKTTGNNHKKIQSVDVREGADWERVVTHFQSAKCQHNSTNSTALFFLLFSGGGASPTVLEQSLPPPRALPRSLSHRPLLAGSNHNIYPAAAQWKHRQSTFKWDDSVRRQPGPAWGANSSDPSDLGREHCCGRLIGDRRTRQGESPGSEQTAECAADNVPSLGEGGWWRGGGSWLKHWIHFGVIIARSELLDFFWTPDPKKKKK